jgi:hypothetical protein
MGQYTLTGRTVTGVDHDGDGTAEHTREARFSRDGVFRGVSPLALS